MGRIVRLGRIEGTTGVESVTTISLNFALRRFSTAFPEKTPCVAAAYTSLFAPCSMRASLVVSGARLMEDGEFRSQVIGELLCTLGAANIWRDYDEIGEVLL